MNDDFKTYEEKAWEDKASRYDDTWGKVSSQVIPDILELIEDTGEVRCLDVGCGPGHLSGAMREAETLGVDYSENMLAVARENYPTKKFQKEDAENLSFDSGTFDVVTLNYLLLHVSDQERALSEATRVLKSSGILIYSMWLNPAESEGLSLCFEPVKKYADLTVIPPAQDIFTFSYKEKALDFLESNNFHEIHFSTVPTYWKVRDGEELFKAVQAGTRIGGTIDLQTDEVKQKIKDSILKNVEQYKNEDHYKILTPSLLVSAVKV